MGWRETPCKADFCRSHLRLFNEIRYEKPATANKASIEWAGEAGFPLSIDDATHQVTDIASSISREARGVLKVMLAEVLKGQGQTVPGL